MPLQDEFRHFELHGEEQSKLETMNKKKGTDRRHSMEKGSESDRTGEGRDTYRITMGDEQRSGRGQFSAASLAPLVI
uniref:Uncharacterized protein n=1 Tax=Globodera rostochiensis TaxID=31243 RepID=A0A914GU11_GLORO